jgi:hypothetical protein
MLPPTLTDPGSAETNCSSSYCVQDIVCDSEDDNPLHVLTPHQGTTATQRSAVSLIGKSPAIDVSSHITVPLPLSCFAETASSQDVTAKPVHTVTSPFDSFLTPEHDITTSSSFIPDSELGVCEPDIICEEFTSQSSALSKSLGSIAAVVTVELCCGSAGLSAQLKHKGMDSVGVDWIRNPNKPKAPILQADLASDQGQEIVLNILNTANTEYSHAAPPCGTASRSREKPIPLQLIRAGAPQPRQLRSADKPEGLDGLTVTEQLRVDLANSIYRFVAVYMTLCHSRGRLWSIENPRSSYFWLMPEISALMSIQGVKVVDFQQCMHGGTRPVWRRWIGNIPNMETLQLSCDNSHNHESFSITKSQGEWRFATSQEAEYPLLLCKRVAELVFAEIILRGYTALPASLNEADQHNLTKRLRKRASVGIFIRGNRLPPIIEEFHTVVEIFHDAQPGTVITLPDGRVGKVLRLVKGVSLGAQNVAVGIFRSPNEFHIAAVQQRHPVDLMTSTPDVTKKNIFWLLTTSAHEVAKFRLQQLLKLKSLVHSLESEELATRSSLSPQTQKVLEGKQFLALRSLLAEAGYPDLEAVDESLKGIQVTGPIPISGIFPRKLRAATLTSKQLREASGWTRSGAFFKIRPSSTPDLDNKVWSETIKERDNGWMSGPFTLEEVEQRLGKQFVITRRFGVIQGGKVRPIDDFSENCINDTISSFEKIDLMSTDDYVAVLKVAICSVHEDDTVSTQLDNGEILKGKLAPGLSKLSSKQWLGKTFDLKGAYKQLATRSDEAWATVCGVWNPELGRASLFLIHAVPFGSIGSVFGFNRIARALWAAISFLLRVVITNYYDDYPAAELKSNASGADISIKAAFALLGWVLSSEPGKNKEFSESFSMLGVVMDMSLLPSDTIRVSNKLERSQAISAQLGEIVQKSFCSSVLAGEIRGKVQFASNQIYGRMALGPLHSLAIHQYTSRSGIVGEVLRLQLLELMLLLAEGKPRMLYFKGEQRPVLVYSDGACEGESRNEVTIGAVIVDTVNSDCFMFGWSVPADLVLDWKRDGKVQTIGQAELLPILVVRHSFRAMLRHRRIFFFIDNDSARMSMIRGMSPSDSSNRIISCFNRIESEEQSWAWFARVPSPSNPGDGPSRLRLEPAAENLYSRRVDTLPVPREVYSGS